MTEQEHKLKGASKRMVSSSMWSEAEVELEAPLTTGKPKQGWCRPIKLGIALEVGYFCIAESSSPTGHAEISISPQLYKWEKLSVHFSVQLLFSVGCATTAEFVTVTAGSKNNVRLETKK